MLPRRCVGCGRAGFALCSGCLPIGAVLRLSAGGSPTVAATEYAGAVRAALIRYKERGRRDLGPPLADLLLRSVSALLAEVRVPPHAIRLVPAPSGRAAAAARGGDHLVRLARRVGAALGIPVDTPLALIRPVADSAGLTAGQRAENLHDAFVAHPPGSGNSPAAPHFALLVDDIVTTGATLREASRTLTGAGWSVVGAAVVAATPQPAGKRFAAHPLAPPTLAV